MLHSKYAGMCANEFGGNGQFLGAAKAAFKTILQTPIAVSESSETVQFTFKIIDFVTQGKFSIPELLSSFCDRLLKTGGEKLSDEEFGNFLDRTVHLFNYLEDKDIFIEIYRLFGHLVLQSQVVNCLFYFLVQGSIGQTPSESALS